MNRIHTNLVSRDVSKTSATFARHCKMADSPDPRLSTIDTLPDSMKAPGGSTTDPVYAVLDAIAEGTSPLIPWTARDMGQVAAQLDRELIRSTDSVIVFWDLRGAHFGTPVNIEVLQNRYTRMTLCRNGEQDTYLAGTHTPAMLIPRLHPALTVVKAERLQRAFTIPFESQKMMIVQGELTFSAVSQQRSAAGIESDDYGRIFAAMKFIDPATSTILHLSDPSESGDLISVEMDDASDPDAGIATSGMSGSSTRYPDFQFDKKTGAIIPLVAYANRKLGVALNQCEAQWRAARWWATPLNMLDGLSPLQALESGRLGQHVVDQLLAFEGAKSC
ncbi:hypothetical protein ACSW29_27200 [Rhodococcus sp. GB-02]